MPEGKTSAEEPELKTSLSLPVGGGPDEFSPPESSFEGKHAMPWDRALLRPFVSWRKLDSKHSEAEIFQEVIAEGTAYLLYQRIKEEADPELQSGGVFLKLQQSYYYNLAQNI